MRNQTRGAISVLLATAIGSSVGCKGSDNGLSAERCKERGGLAAYLCTSGASLVPDVLSQCGNVSTTDGFNLNGLFAGSFSSSGSDAEGRLAIAGDATFSDYSIGAKASSRDPGRPVLYVGGHLSFQRGTVTGSIAEADCHSDIADIDSGAIVHEVPNLSELHASVTLESRLLAQLPTTGSTDKQDVGGGRLSIRFVGERAALNVFSISAEELSRASSVSIDIPAGASAIINITGTDLILSDHSTTLANGLVPNRVLWNGPTVQHLDAHGIALEGSYLLPEATVSFNDGHLDGTLVAGTFDGNGQLNDALFDGCYPPTSRIAQFFKFGGIQSLARDASGNLLASWTALDPATQLTGYSIFVRTGQDSYNFTAPSDVAGVADASKLLSSTSPDSICAVVRAIGLPFEDVNTVERCALRALGLSTLAPAMSGAQQARLTWDGVAGLAADTSAQVFVRSNPGSYDFTQPVATLAAAAGTSADFPLTAAQAGSYCALVRYVAGAVVIGQSDERCVSVPAPTLVSGPSGAVTSASYSFGFGGGAQSYRAVVLSGDVSCPEVLTGPLSPIGVAFAGTAPNTNGSNTLCAIGYGADETIGSYPTRRVWTVNAPAPAPLDFAITGGFTAQGAEITIRRGGTVTIPVSVSRFAGTATDIVISALTLPAGVTAQPLTIGAGQLTGSLVLSANATATLGLSTTQIQGSSQGATRTAPMALRVLCPAGALEDAVCTPVATSLSQLRWELPCTLKGNGFTPVCGTLPGTSSTTSLGGDPTQTYNVTLRFRGVIELRPYVGGVANGYFLTGGQQGPDPHFNVYALTTSSPAQTFYLNAAPDLTSSLATSFAVDYVRTIQIRGGSQIGLATNSLDSLEKSNFGPDQKPYVIPGVAPFPAAYDGEFLQMDVVSVTAATP